MSGLKGNWLRYSKKRKGRFSCLETTLLNNSSIESIIYDV